MINTVLHQVSTHVSRLVTWLRGFEETGEIPIDSVSFEVRSGLTLAGIL